MLPTIFITFPNSFSVRNVVFTGALELLADRYDGRIVLFVAGERTRQLLTDLPGNVIVESLPPFPGRTLTKLLQASLAARFYRLQNAPALSTRLKHQRATLPVHHLAKTMLTWPFPRNKRIFKFLRALDRRSGRVSATVREHFRTHQPCLVVATDPNTEAEYEFLRHAQRTGIATAGFVRSWDVPSTKGWFPVIPDDVIVWNDWVSSQVMTMHQVPAERMHVVGVPQFDVYAKPAVPGRIDTLFGSFGFNTDLPVVLYAGSPPRITLEEPQIVVHLANALEGKAQILVRIHPQDDPERWSKVDLPNVSLQVPGQALTGILGGRLMAEGELEGLRDTLAGATVVISAWSTMMLDASAMGTPAIAVNFDCEPKPPHLSIRRFTESDHTKKVIESGAVAVAESLDELVNLVKADLAEPDARKVEMKQLVETMCGPVDGLASERLAEVIFRLAEKRAPAASS